MQRKTKWIAGGTLAFAIIGGTAGIAIATGADREASPTGSALEKATAAALDHTGGGTVTETELGDDGAAYGVEVRRADGSQVEVRLDERFRVIGQESDDDGTGGSPSGD
jgi:uncharacterized membrane protein YkoI